MSCLELNNEGFDKWIKFIHEESKKLCTEEIHSKIAFILDKLEELFDSKNLQEIEPKRRLCICLWILPSRINNSNKLTDSEMKCLEFIYDRAEEEVCED